MGNMVLYLEAGGGGNSLVMGQKVYWVFIRFPFRFGFP